MRIDLFVTPQEIPLFYTKGRRVIVVDVLRACTSMSYALDAGAEQIIPADTVESVKQLMESLDRESSLLAGEQDGAKLPGFDLGNSPRDFQGEGIQGKTIVYASSNGAPLLTRSMEAVEKLLLSFVNMDAVVRYLAAKEDTELTVICAGQGGRFSMEDTVAAGMLIDELGVDGDEADLNDGARAAWILFLAHRKDIGSVVRTSMQGRFLTDKGMAADLVEASNVNALQIVPVAREGRVTAG